MAELTAESLAEATGTDADGVPPWDVDAFGVTAALGAFRVEFNDSPADLPDVCRRIRAALAAFSAVSA